MNHKKNGMEFFANGAYFQEIVDALKGYKFDFQGWDGLDVWFYTKMAERTLKNLLQSTNLLSIGIKDVSVRGHTRNVYLKKYKACFEDGFEHRFEIEGTSRYDDQEVILLTGSKVNGFHRNNFYFKGLRIYPDPENGGYTLVSQYKKKTGGLETMCHKISLLK